MDRSATRLLYLDAEVRYHRAQKLENVLGFEFHKLVRISSTSDASRISLDGWVE